MPNTLICPCGTGTSINVHDVVRAVVPVRWPGVQQVANGALWPALRVDLLTQSLVRSELVDWGAAVLARRAAGAAEALVPGVSWFHHFHSGYRALSAARRGDVPGVLQRLPWPALLPTAVRTMLHEAWAAVAPEPQHMLSTYDGSVMLLATGALLCDLASAPADSPDAQSSPAQQAMLRTVRGARAVLESLRGIGNALVSNQAPGADLPALEGPLDGSAARTATLSDNATQNCAALSLAGSQLVTVPEPADEAPAAAAWPFPGAVAAPARKGSAPHPPPKPHHGGQGMSKGGRSTGTHARAGSRRVSHQTSRRQHADAGEEGEFRAGSQASRNPAAMVGHVDGPKEAMQNPLNFGAIGYAGGDHSGKRDKPEVPDSVKAPRLRVDAAELIVQTGRRNQAGNVAGRRNAPLLQAPPGQSLLEEFDDLALECLEFQDVDMLSLLMRGRRYQPGLIRVCVEPEQSAQFTAWMNQSADSHRSMGQWMVSAAIDEGIPSQDAMAGSGRRLEGLEDFFEGLPNPPEASTGRVFTVLTLSLLDEALRREAGSWNLPRLHANTFRLVRFKALDGSDLLYLAYFLHRDAGNQRGVNGGFLPVTSDATGTLSVEDQVHGTRITAATLANLVMSVQQLTGLRYLGQWRTASAQPTPVPATNLFVDDNQTLATGATDRHLPFNGSLQLFAPVLVELSGQSEPVPMYYGSFIVRADEVAYCDETGGVGVLPMTTSDKDSDRLELRCRTSADCIFATSHGLKQAASYARDEVCELLQQSGLVRLRGPEGSGVVSSVCSAAAPGDKDAESGEDWPELLPERSSFRFHDGTLDFVDHDGREGALTLERVPRMLLPRYRLPRVQEPAQQAFAAQNGFVMDVVYSEAEIEKLLQDRGYIRSAQ